MPGITSRTPPRTTRPLYSGRRPPSASPKSSTRHRRSLSTLDSLTLTGALSHCISMPCTCLCKAANQSYHKKQRHHNRGGRNNGERRKNLGRAGPYTGFNDGRGPRPNFRRRRGKVPKSQNSPKIIRVPPYVQIGTSDFGRGPWPPCPPLYKSVSVCQESL